MEIVITQWALDSYLDAKHSQVFTGHEYWNQIRPDVLQLQNYDLAKPPFNNTKFWSQATVRKQRVADGYKMKWHNVGNGKVQLRLGVGLITNKAFLCHSYVKSSPQRDQRELANLKFRLERIRQGNYIERGRLK